MRTVQASPDDVEGNTSCKMIPPPGVVQNRFQMVKMPSPPVFMHLIGTVPSRQGSSCLFSPRQGTNYSDSSYPILVIIRGISLSLDESVHYWVILRVGGRDPVTDSVEWRALETEQSLPQRKTYISLQPRVLLTETSSFSPAVLHPGK